MAADLYLQIFSSFLFSEGFVEVTLDLAEEDITNYLRHDHR